MLQRRVREESDKRLARGWYKIVIDKKSTEKIYKMVGDKKEATIFSEAEAQEVKMMFDHYYGKAMLVKV